MKNTMLDGEFGNKAAIRRGMRARRKALAPEDKARAAADICRRIVALPDLKGPWAVYLASPDEIDLSAAIKALLARGDDVVAPRWNGITYELARLKSLRDDDLRTGPMNILEPKDEETVPSADVAVWLVPGLAFTRDGKRFGYGGGWYDRLLAEADLHAQKFGIAYGFQVMDDLPCEPHDILMDGLFYVPRSDVDIAPPTPLPPRTLHGRTPH